MLVTTDMIATLRANATPPAGRNTSGRVVSKALVVKTLGISRPTLNAFVAKNGLQPLDGATGEKGVGLEELVETLGSTAVLRNLDDRSALDAGGGIPIDLIDVEAADGFDLKLVARALAYAMDHDLLKSFEQLIQLALRLAARGDDG